MGDCATCKLFEIWSVQYQWLIIYFAGSIFVNENEMFLKKGSQPVLLVESKGHALHAFINKKLQGA